PVYRHRLSARITGHGKQRIITDAFCRINEKDITISSLQFIYSGCLYPAASEGGAICTAINWYRQKLHAGGIKTQYRHGVICQYHSGRNGAFCNDTMDPADPDIRNQMYSSILL